MRPSEKRKIVVRLDSFGPIYFMLNGSYLVDKAPENYPGKLLKGKYAYVHHIVWWQHTGEVPKKGFSIHHKDANRFNNALSNLELLSTNEHAALHNRNRRKPTVHGTLNAWRHHMCRCPECRLCYNKYQREYKRKIRGSLA